MNNLGALLEQTGDVDAVRRWYERALAGGDPRAKYHLGAMATRDGDLQPLRTWFLDGVDADTADVLPLGHLPVDIRRIQRALFCFPQIDSAPPQNTGLPPPGAPA